MFFWIALVVLSAIGVWGLAYTWWVDILGNGREDRQ